MTFSVLKQKHKTLVLPFVRNMWPEPCLEKYVSLPLCESAAGSVLVTDFPAISYKSIVDLLDKDKTKLLEIFQSAKRFASEKFINDFANIVSAKIVICEPSFFTYFPKGWTTVVATAGFDVFTAYGNNSRTFSLIEPTINVASPGTFNFKLEAIDSNSNFTIWEYSVEFDVPGIYQIPSPPSIFTHMTEFEYKFSWSGTGALVKAAPPEKANYWKPAKCGCYTCKPDCALLDVYGSGIAYKTKCECTFWGEICNNAEKFKYAYASLVAATLLKQNILSTAHNESAHLKTSEKESAYLELLDEYKTSLKRAAISTAFDCTSGCFKPNQKIKQIFRF